MREAKFKIGDMVEASWIGTCKVTDVLYSSSKDEYTYEVTNEQTASEFFGEDELKLVPEKKDYSMDIKIDIAKNVVIAPLYESVGGTEACWKGTRPSHPRRRGRNRTGRKLRLQKTL